ncbi:hypothetical protein PybrP1_009987 [[Pythium] brassicae (nom. inval.)]|nr:hypothetical protein PybrP1_009987 [[Pythium] brassicae (nom. inval.)]
MHRAEKSSSRICRNREVERAQELHRKKLDGVKSYLSGAVSRPPAVIKPVAGASFRRFKPVSTASSALSRADSSCCGSAGFGSCLGGVSEADLGADDDEQAGDSASVSSGITAEALGYEERMETSDREQAAHSNAKADECRSVAPAAAIHATHHPSPRHVQLFRAKAAPPPLEGVGSKKKTLNGSLRMRRLKEIELDNLGLFERIKKSAAHYRNDDLKREWEQNASYLSSICEFPVLLPSPRSELSFESSASADSNSDDGLFGASSQGFKASLSRPHEHFPSIQRPAVVHPIRAVPTPPRKLQLNLSPAFRSLRKGMPQQPALPPLTAAPGSNTNGVFDDDAAASGDGHLSDSQAKYELLKMGRFVGGAYLSLTVFCGDGVRNPYGFDVVAFDRESACEYRLSVTKEMTHELLDTVSSSSQAAVTAAAAGTNLSMDDIARSICDHVNFADLGAESGEMLFLATSAGGQKNAALLLCAAPPSFAFCVHQVVEVECAGGDSELLGDKEERGDRDGTKRRLHVFASTRPVKAATVPCRVASLPQTVDLEVDMALTELYEIANQHWEGEASGGTKTTRASARRARTLNERVPFSAKDQVSVERVVVVAMRHLHIVNVPSSETSNELAQVLIVNDRVNALLRPVSKLRAPEKSRLTHQLSRAASPIRKQPFAGRSGLCVLETGAIWKSAYVLARVSIDTGGTVVDTGDETSDERGNAINAVPQYIQEVDAPVRISVFNSLTARYSERELSPDQVDCVVEKLAVLVADGDVADVLECVTFAKHVVTRLQIEVDLFGAEVLTFPSLGIKQPLNSRAEQQLGCGGYLSRSASQLSSNWSNSRCSLGRQLSHDRTAQLNASVREAREYAATLIQATVRGYLFRKQYYDDGVEGEGDAGGVDTDAGGEADEDENDQHHCEESRDAHTEMVFGGCKVGQEFCLVRRATSRDSEVDGSGGGDMLTTHHVFVIGALGNVEDRVAMLFLEQTQGFGSGAGNGPSTAQPPSLFELLMQERMAGGVKPALEYLVHTATESYPQLSAALPVRRLEETFALLRLLTERYFLARYDSLATERFYGMKRVSLRTAAAPGGVGEPLATEPLSDAARRQSLLYAVMLPYVKAKLDNYFRTLQETLPRTMPATPTASAARSQSEADGSERGNGGRALVAVARARMNVFLQRLQQLQVLFRLKRAFLQAYPFAHFAYEGSFFLYQWLYLFGDTPYFSPLLRRMKIVLVRVTAADESMLRQSQSDYRDQMLAKLSGSSVAMRARRFLLRASWATVDHSYVLLLLGVAGYKFIEWMYSEEGVAVKMRMTGADSPIPPPPLPPQFSGSALTLSSADPAACPVCGKARVNPAMAVSGYVFCYTCIYRYVEQHGECPVTQMTCDLPSIAKIYDDARDV